MSTSRNNYLRSYRKGIGLSQREVAFLLGSDDDGLVSRYEKGQILPSLRTALAFGTLFDTAVSVLFSETQAEGIRDILPRIEQLRAHIEEIHKERKWTAADIHKLRWLEERLVALH